MSQKTKHSLHKRPHLGLVASSQPLTVLFHKTETCANIFRVQMALPQTNYYHPSTAVFLFYFHNHSPLLHLSSICFVSQFYWKPPPPSTPTTFCSYIQSDCIKHSFKVFCGLSWSLSLLITVKVACFSFLSLVIEIWKTFSYRRSLLSLSYKVNYFHSIKGQMCY